MAQGLQRAVNAARATRGQPPRPVHLTDPHFADLNRTFCGLVSPALITAVPGEVTCKTCLNAHRRVAAQVNAEAMAHESLKKG